MPLDQYKLGRGRYHRNIYGAVDFGFGGVSLDEAGGNIYYFRVKGNGIGNCQNTAIEMSSSKVEQLIRHFKVRLATKTGDMIDEPGFILPQGSIHLENIGGRWTILLKNARTGTYGYTELTRAQIGGVIRHLQKRLEALNVEKTGARKTSESGDAFNRMFGGTL